MDKIFGFFTDAYKSVEAWIINVYNMAVAYFTSLSIEWLVLYGVGALLFVGLIIFLCALGAKRKRKKKALEKEKQEQNKRALEEFISEQEEQPDQAEQKQEQPDQEQLKEEEDLSDTQAEEVTSEPTDTQTEEITSEPTVTEKEVEIPISYVVEKVDSSLRGAFDEEHNVERSEDIEHGFCEDVESGSFSAHEHFESESGEEKAEALVAKAPQEVAQGEQKEVFDFVKDKEKKPLLGFRQKIIDSENDIKARYCDIVNFAMSYKKIKVRSSESGEKFYYGSNLLFMLKLHGKTLRAYYALRFADYENTTMPVSDESAKKSYEKTPVMLKVTSALALRRAKSLVSDVMTRYACEKGKEKTVVTVQELTQEMQRIAQTEEQENAE